MPPTPPPDNFDQRIPQDAPDVFQEIDTFFEYLEKIDKIIEANWKGYESLSADQINSIRLTPLEPCNVQEGLFNHIRFTTKRVSSAGDYPFDMEDTIPLIIRDPDEYYDVTFNNNDHPLHFYITQSKCTETAVQNFHESIIRQASRFRHNIDRMLEQRRLLSSIADVFGGEMVLKGKQLQKVFNQNYVERELKFIFKNKLEIENKINNLHFAIEALRTNIIRMFDEMFGRRMGWGYQIQNPGHKFMVFVRHSQIVKQYIPPENIPLSESNSTEKPLLNKRSVNTTSCIVNVHSIDQLSQIMDKKSNIDFQIFNFIENEEKLKLKIENLKNVFNSWLKISHGYFNTEYYKIGWHKIWLMFNAFDVDVLQNPKYGSVNTKSEIINDLKKILLDQMDYSIKWYYYPEKAVEKLETFIQKIYKNKYPKKPPQHEIPFHGEL